MHLKRKGDMEGFWRLACKGLSQQTAGLGSSVFNSWFSSTRSPLNNLALLARLRRSTAVGGALSPSTWGAALSVLIGSLQQREGLRCCLRATLDMELSGHTPSPSQRARWAKALAAQQAEATNRADAGLVRACGQVKEALAAVGRQGRGGDRLASEEHKGGQPPPSLFKLRGLPAYALPLGSLQSLRSLAWRFHGQLAPDLGAALGLAAQAAGQVAALHRLGYVHRDVKADNFLVAEDQSQGKSRGFPRGAAAGAAAGQGKAHELACVMGERAARALQGGCGGTGSGAGSRGPRGWTPDWRLWECQCGARGRRGWLRWRWSGRYGRAARTQPSWAGAASSWCAPSAAMG